MPGKQEVKRPFREECGRRGLRGGGGVCRKRAGPLMRYRLGVRKGGRDVAQFGSALDWGSRGRRFKSGRPDQKVQVRRGSGFRPGPLFDLREPNGEPLVRRGFLREPDHADLARYFFEFLVGFLAVVFGAARILFMAVAPVVSAGRISCR